MNDLSKRLRAWSPPRDWVRVLAIDAHAAGEPLRVIVDGFPDPGGTTVLERRRKARENFDDLRRALMWEPRGHADMYGCILGAPISEEADFGVLFAHNDGFSTMCGHGIIGVVTVALECGLVSPANGSFGIDTPAGLIRARAEVVDGRVPEVTFENVPSFAARLDASVTVAGVGEVRYDLAYGGAYYAYVDAADFGLELVPAEAARLIDLGRRIKDTVQAADPPVHPEAEELGFMYGTIFVGPAHEAGGHSRNVCVFANGEVDRSPTGTGVSGRLALHHARQEVAMDETIEIESILGTRFGCRVVRAARVGEEEAIVPEVSGQAWITGRNELLLAPGDPLVHGFLLR